MFNDMPIFLIQISRQDCVLRNPANSKFNPLPEGTEWTSASGFQLPCYVRYVTPQRGLSYGLLLEDLLYAKLEQREQQTGVKF
jgi:hypothetical protein